jgi:hypothetical protein
VTVVLDTCAIVWAVSDPGRLAPRAVSLLETDDTEVCVSTISCAEIEQDYVPPGIPDGSIYRVDYRIEGGRRPVFLYGVRHPLYVACTRARDRLLVTGVEPASEFLDDLRE